MVRHLSHFHPECLALVDLCNYDGKELAEDFLIELTDAEIAFRDERARKINITVSHFPYIKTVKDFDFSYQPTINKDQIMDFLSLRFIEQKSNIIFVGSAV